MFVSRRWLGWLCWLSWCAALTFAACSKSHDVEPNGQALNPDDGGSRSGAGGSAGRAAAGAGGRVAVGGAGRAGTAAGGPVVGAAGGGMVSNLACGTCASASILGFLNAPACCTTDNKCGLDLSGLGVTGCLEANAAGKEDPSCPMASILGIVNFPGCCRPDGQCGALDTLVGLGCAAGLVPDAGTCTPK